MTNKPKLWTPEEDEYLKAHMSTTSLKVIGAHLGRSWSSVNQRITRLNLRTEENRQRKYWTPEEDAFLSTNLNNMTAAEIGAHLDRKPNSVSSRMRILKLERNNPLVMWTEEEDEYVLAKYGMKSLDSIAAHVKRTPLAVERRLSRLGVYGAKENTGYMTVPQLAYALHVDDHTVYRWMENNSLPFKKGTAKVREHNLIDVLEFWKWAEQNRDLINFFKIPKNSLIPEPEWVNQQRKVDYLRRPHKENQNWTGEDDAYLWLLFYGDGRTQKEIGEIMGRTETAVQRRLARLREKRKAV